MPMLNLECLEGHTDEEFIHTWADKGCTTRICLCGNTLVSTLSVGRGLTYFEEGRARFIENLGGVWITSHEQHKRVMKERGVEPAIGEWVSTKGTGWAHHLPKASAKRVPDVILPNVGGDV